jgi:hypothetical protein
METINPTGAELTARIRHLLDEVTKTSNLRQEVWYDENRAGASQLDLAEKAGVVEHTVYCEIRKHRERVDT